MKYRIEVYDNEGNSLIIAYGADSTEVEKLREIGYKVDAEYNATPRDFEDIIQLINLFDFRERLLDRMIRLHGFENEITIQFAQLCERYPKTMYNNKALETILTVHEQEMRGEQ